LKVNGEAIYGTRPWNVCQNETDSSVFYTKKGESLYALFTAWPAQNILELAHPIPTEDTHVQFLGTAMEYTLEWNALVEENRDVSLVRRNLAPGLRLQLPALTPDVIPCEHAWVVVITGLANI